MSRSQVNFRLPDRLIAALKQRAQQDNLSVTELVIRFCQEALGLVPSSPSTHSFQALEDRIHQLEKDVQELQRQQASNPSRSFIHDPNIKDPKDPDPRILLPSAEPLVQPEAPALPSNQWDPLTSDFDSWLFQTWLRVATEQAGEVCWGVVVSTDVLHEAGFQVMRKQRFLDHLTTSEAVGLELKSFDPSQPELEWISCRVASVTFVHPFPAPPSDSPRRP